MDNPYMRPLYCVAAVTHIYREAHRRATQYRAEVNPPNNKRAARMTLWSVEHAPSSEKRCYLLIRQDKLFDQKYFTAINKHI